MARKSSRTGKSLIEVLIVISIMGAIMTPAVRLIHTMMGSERESVRALTVSSSAARLARQFRRDVHAATGVEIVRGEDEEAPRLELQVGAGKTVTYVSAADEVLRTVAEGDDGQPVSRESYHVPAGQGRFETRGNPPLVVLIHERSASEEHGRARTSSGMKYLRIEAVLGRDHRFSE